MADPLLAWSGGRALFLKAVYIRPPQTSDSRFPGPAALPSSLLPSLAAARRVGAVRGPPCPASTSPSPARSCQAEPHPFPTPPARLVVPRPALRAPTILTPHPLPGFGLEEGSVPGGQAGGRPTRPPRSPILAELAGAMLDLGNPVRQPLRLPLGSWDPQGLDAPSQPRPNRLGWGPDSERAGRAVLAARVLRRDGEPVCQVEAASSSQGPAWGCPRPTRGRRSPPPTFHSHTLSLSFGEILGLVLNCGSLGRHRLGAPLPSMGTGNARVGEQLFHACHRAQRPEPSAQHPEPRAQHPVPRARNPMPKVQSPVPGAQCPEPGAQCPEPSAQCPEPSAQNPEPKIPEPRAQRPAPGARSPAREQRPGSPAGRSCHG